MFLYCYKGCLNSDHLYHKDCACDSHDNVRIWLEYRDHQPNFYPDPHLISNQRTERCLHQHDKFYSTQVEYVTATTVQFSTASAEIDLSFTSTLLATYTQTLPIAAFSTSDIAATSTIFTTSETDIPTTLLTTTTISSTVKAAASPTVSPYLVVVGGSQNGRYLVSSPSSYVTFSATAAGATKFGFVNGGQPYLASSPTNLVFTHNGNSLYGALYFEPSGTTDPAISCSLSATGSVTCSGNNGAFYQLITCSGYIYIGGSTLPASGCSRVTLKLASS